MDNVLKETINKIVKRIDGIENEMEKHKKNLTNSTLYGIEPKLFIKGKYISFDQKKQALQILVNGEMRFYSINDYYSEYLPFPDSTVVIFSEVSSDGAKALIFAIKKGEIDKFAKFYELTYKGIKNNSTVFYSDENGYLKLGMNINLVEKYGLKAGQKIQFREVKYGTDQYLIPIMEKNILKQNRLKILSSI